MTLTATTAAIFEDIFRCYRAEMGPQPIDPRSAQELSDRGLITAPKGHDGAVIPSDKALDLFEVYPGEPRNAFDGEFRRVG